MIARKPPEAGREGSADSSLRVPERTNPTYPWSWNSSFENCEMIDLCSSCHAAVVVCHGRPKKRIHQITQPVTGIGGCVSGHICASCYTA